MNSSSTSGQKRSFAEMGNASVPGFVNGFHMYLELNEYSKSTAFRKNLHMRDDAHVLSELAAQQFSPLTKWKLNISSKEVDICTKAENGLLCLTTAVAKAKRDALELNDWQREIKDPRLVWYPPSVDPAGKTEGEYLRELVALTDQSYREFLKVQRARFGCDVTEPKKGWALRHPLTKIQKWLKWSDERKKARSA